MILTLFLTATGLLICAALVKLGLMYLKSYCILLQSKCFQGPKALPLIGSAHLFIGSTVEDIFETIQDLLNNNQSPIRIWIGPRLFFAVSEPEHVKLVLNNSNALGKDAIYDMLAPLTGNGILTSAVPKWKIHRKSIQPLFNRNVLQSYVQSFMMKALNVGEKIRMDEEGKEFDIYYYMARYNFDNICETSLGITISQIDGTYSDFFDVVESALEILIVRLVSPWLYPDLIFKHTSMGQKFQKSIDYLRDFLNDILNNFRQDLQKGIEDQTKQSLLGLLLTSKEHKYTDEEIRDEITTIIGGGFETSATVMSMILFALAKHPDIQEKVYEEVRGIYDECNSKGLEITMQDFNRMEYLDRVIKEILRFVPVAPTILRHLEEEINIGEYTLPADCSVAINIPTIHRNEKYWPEPLQFNPDRFLPMHPLGPRHPCAYLPFSLGPRNCIGAKYAMIISKVLTATLISKYIIKTSMLEDVKDIKMKMRVFLKMKDPIMLSFERRIPETR